DLTHLRPSDIASAFVRDTAPKNMARGFTRTKLAHHASCYRYQLTFLHWQRLSAAICKDFRRRCQHLCVVGVMRFSSNQNSPRNYCLLIKISQFLFNPAGHHRADKPPGDSTSPSRYWPRCPERQTTCRDR